MASAVLKTTAGHITQTLINAFDQNRIAQGYILQDQEGLKDNNLNRYGTKHEKGLAQILTQHQKFHLK